MQENKIRITWYGTASVRIAAGSSNLLIDPFFPFPDSRIKVAENSYADCSHILVSHGHYDHIGSISDIACDDTVIYCTKAPYHSLLRKGVGEKNLNLIKPGSSFTVGDFRITAYKGKHIKLSVLSIIRAVFSKRVMQNRKGIIGKLLKMASCREKKESLCYLLEACGKRILILGSLALDENTVYPTGVDMAFFPYQGPVDLYGIATDIYEKLKPESVLLTHFDDTFPPFSSEIDTTGFEEYMKDRAEVYKLKHGETTEI